MVEHEFWQKRREQQPYEKKKVMAALHADKPAATGAFTAAGVKEMDLAWKYQATSALVSLITDDMAKCMQKSTESNEFQCEMLSKDNHLFAQWTPRRRSSRTRT